MFKTREKTDNSINLLDTREKLTDRERIVDETRSNISIYKYNAENFDLKVNSNNKYADKYNKTIDFVNERPRERSLQSSFKLYYEL
jgi:hypothetical protein